MSHGYLPSTLAPDHYLLGKLEGPEIVKDGQWERWLPADELQKRNGLETSACTSYGTLNALEVLLRKQYGLRENFSERFAATLTDTTREGNDPHRVIETIRKFSGLVPEKSLPFGEDIRRWDQYYTPVPFSLRLDGIKWLTQWEIGHEWVYDMNRASEEAKRSALMQALKFSPIGIAVNAWHKKNGLYYVNGYHNHWCLLYGYREGKWWEVFDHYDDTTKRLEWGYFYGQAKRYSIKPRETALDPKFIIRSFQGLTGLY